jgi:hypothetical protein
MYEIINRFCDRMIQTHEEESKAKEAGQSTEKILQDETWQTSRNMSEWCNYLAFDLMATFIFSGKYNMLEREQYRYVVQCIEQSNIRVASILQAPILKAFRMDKIFFPRAIVARNMFLGFVGKLLRDTKKNDRSQRKDLFEMLSHAKDPESGKGFTPEEIVAESVTLVVAGADTSATAMAAIFFYLSRNPDAYARAAAEVRSTFSSVEDIQGGAKPPRLHRRSHAYVTFSRPNTCKRGTGRWSRHRRRLHSWRLRRRRAYLFYSSQGRCLLRPLQLQP